MPKISVITPVYKVENYLRKCVDSILVQTFSDFELFIVDDGSPDGCGKIADEYEKIDSRVHTIHKENGGISSARNVAIDIAEGDYITFIDSDDDVELDLVEYLYNILKNFNCKMSVCTHNIIKKKKVKKSFNLKADYKLSSRDCIKRLLYNDGIDTSAWAKLYDKSLFDNIRYPVGKLFEDIATTYKFFIKAKEIACGHLAKYNYRLRENSIVTKKFNISKLDLLESTDNMAKDIVFLFPSLQKAALRRRVYARFSTLNQMLNVDKENYDKVKEMINFITKYKWDILIDGNVPIRDKCAIVLLQINYNLYKYVCQKIKQG